MTLMKRRVYTQLISNDSLEEYDVMILNLVGASFNQAVADYCRVKNKKKIRGGCQTAGEIRHEVITCNLYKTMADLTRYTVEELFDMAVEEYTQNNWLWKVRA